MQKETLSTQINGTTYHNKDTRDEANSVEIEGLNAALGEGLGISGIRYVFDEKIHSLRRYFV